MDRIWKDCVFPLQLTLIEEARIIHQNYLIECFLKSHAFKKLNVHKSASNAFLQLKQQNMRVHNCKGVPILVKLKADIY